MSTRDNSSSGQIRVLWLIKGLGPGGAEQLLVSSAGVADHTGFSYEAAFVRADKDQFVDVLVHEGVATTRLGASGASPLGWVRDLRRILPQYDIVHAHSPLLAGIVRLLSRTIPRSQRPLIVSTEHNVWSNFALPTRLLNALTGPLDDHRWAVSEESRRSMWAPLRRRTEVLRHGVRLDAITSTRELRARTRQALGIAEDALVVITVANLRREKDYPNLMRAASSVLSEQPDTIFLAVGQGPLAAELELVRNELRLGERFRFLGYRQDVAALLGAADLFALGSLQEGLPVAIMEALNQALPIVATDVGGVSEAVTDDMNGYLVPAKDPQALARAMLRVLQDDDLRATLGAGSAMRTPDFDIRTAVDRQQSVYQELVQRRRSA